MKTKVILTGVLFILLSSCHCPEKRSSQKNHNPVITLKPTIREGFRASADKPAYTIGKASLENDVLVIQASYPGGCEEHRFELVFNGMYLKSLPMKAVLYLEHTSADTCLTPLEITLRYDIKELMPPGHDKVILLLHSYDKDLLYIRPSDER